MQYQSLEMEHRLICSTRGVQTPAEVHAYSRCDVSVSIASRSPVPALGFRKIRDPTWRKSKSKRLHKLNHDSAGSTSIHTQQGNCTIACNWYNAFLHPCPTVQPCHFGSPHPSWVCSLHPQRTPCSFAVVYCSSSYWSLMH